MLRSHPCHQGHFAGIIQPKLVQRPLSSSVWKALPTFTAALRAPPRAPRGIGHLCPSPCFLEGSSPRDAFSPGTREAARALLERSTRVSASRRARLPALFGKLRPAPQPRGAPPPSWRNRPHCAGALPLRGAPGPSRPLRPGSLRKEPPPDRGLPEGRGDQRERGRAAPPCGPVLGSSRQAGYGARKDRPAGPMLRQKKCENTYMHACIHT